MKILFLDFDDLKNPLGGGQARVTYEICRRLAKRHEITVVTSRYSGSKNEVIENIKYVRIGLNNFPFNFAAYFIITFWIVRKIPHDILVESFIPPISTINTPLFSKKPVVGIAHWFFAKEMSQKYKLPFVLWERFFIKFYKNLIVFNEDWADKFRKLIPKSNILVNNFPVEGPKVKPRFREKNYILFLGRIDVHQKGLDLLLKAFEKVSRKTSVKLIIAGGGRQEKYLKKLLKNSNCAEKINFIGRYNLSQKNELLKSCKFVVLPSRYETGPLVAKEAMSFAKPVIAFKIRGTREVLSSECALLVKPYNVKLFAKAILSLLQNPKKRKKMGEAARERFEKDIKWDEAAKRQEEFFKQIIYRLK